MDHDRRFPGWMNQVYNVEENKVTPYNNHTVIIMDDIDRDDNDRPLDRGEGNADVEHASKCHAIYELFRDCFANCQIRSARMPPRQDERCLHRFMRQELDQKTRQDVVIIYFHGKAGGEGNDYTWVLKGPGPKQVNAHKLISQANESEADLLFIIDGYMPTRLRKPWKRKDRMTEFMIAGPQHRDTDGRVLEGSAGFTESLCRSLRRMVKKPFGMTRMTIPLIVGMDKSNRKNPNAPWLPSKSLRVWVHRPNRRKATRVWRLIIDKESVARTHLLEFRACEVTGNRFPPGDVGRGGGGGNVGGGNEGGGGGGGNGGGDDDDSDSDGNDSDEEDDDDDKGHGEDGNNDGGDDNNAAGDRRPRSAIRAPRLSPSPAAVVHDEILENNDTNNDEQEDRRSRRTTPTPRRSPSQPFQLSPYRRFKRSRSPSERVKFTLVVQDLTAFKQEHPDTPDLAMTAAYSTLIDLTGDDDEVFTEDAPGRLDVFKTEADDKESLFVPKVEEDEERESSRPNKRIAFGSDIPFWGS